MLTEFPIGNDYQSYSSWWNWALINLKLLLNNATINLEKRTKTSSILDLLKRAEESYRLGDKSGVVDLAQLIDFIKNLDYLKENDLDLYELYKNKLTSGFRNDFSYLTGTWFEVQICCMLKKCQLKFSMPDPPDFKVDLTSQNVNIECYAPRTKEGDKIYPKLLNTIRRKKIGKYKGQSWTKSRPVLFIDGTWTIRAQGSQIVQGQEIISKELLQTLEELYQIGFYQMIIFFYSGFVTESNFNASTCSCVWLPSSIKDATLIKFKNSLLENFKEENDLKIIIPDLPERNF
ncbi:MAG: hypothetical protein RIG77_08250 [Cyclobacteriaceae bacterium]